MQIPGIIHRDDLRARGVPREVIEQWLSSGEVVSVQPWYVRSIAPGDVVELLRLGVRPTCLDAAALHGLWIPPHPGTHVFRPRSRSEAEKLTSARAIPVRRRNGAPPPGRRREALVLHIPEPRAWIDTDPVPALPMVLEHAGRCLPVEKTAILLESALHRQQLTGRDVDGIVATLPMRTRRSLRRVRSDAESGTETRVRWWFESRGIGIRSQVRFPLDHRRMDLLVGESWVIECDGREFHDDPDSFEVDRGRDLHLAAHGYRITRLSWRQVFLDWDRTRAMLRAMHSRGDHLRPPKTGAGLVMA